MSKRVKYEVDVGSGCGTGSVFVDDNATDDDIRLAILDDLYDVNYEVTEYNKYAIVEVFSEKNGLVYGALLETLEGSLEEAIQQAKTYRVNTAVVENKDYTRYQIIFEAKRLDKKENEE